MKVLLAVDGSPCSDAAVRSVAERPWPTGTEVEVVTVVHTSMPLIPDPTLTGVGMYWSALEEDRQTAPTRVAAAQHRLADALGTTVTGAVLEGDPSHAIVDEARRWNADLVVVGSHGYGVVKKVALGSVSQRVAAHAPCSVEIVRCQKLSDAETA